MIQIPNEIIIPEVIKRVNEGYTVTLPLSGYSMRPYLEHLRDKALLTAAPEDLKVGDVVLAEIRPQTWALHRIVKIEGDDITIYGDGNYSPEYVKRNDITCKAIGFYRKGSRRLDSVETLSYRFYWHSWVRLRPIRRYLLLVWRLWLYPCQTFRELKKKV